MSYEQDDEKENENLKKENTELVEMISEFADWEQLQDTLFKKFQILKHATMFTNVDSSTLLDFNKKIKKVITDAD